MECSRYLDGEPVWGRRGRWDGARVVPSAPSAGWIGPQATCQGAGRELNKRRRSANRRVRGPSPKRAGTTRVRRLQPFVRPTSSGKIRPKAVTPLQATATGRNAPFQLLLDNGRKRARARFSSQISAWTKPTALTVSIPPTQYVSSYILDRHPSCDAADHALSPSRGLARHHRPHLRPPGRSLRPRGGTMPIRTRWSAARLRAPPKFIMSVS